MSTKATVATWDLKAPLITSTEKLFLLACADRAGEAHECWPSLARLCADTSLDRKTIIKVRQSVIDKKLMEYTGSFQGHSGQIPVMRLTYVDNSTVSEFTSPKNGTGTSPKNGTADQSQIWDTEPKTLNLKEEHTREASPRVSVVKKLDTGIKVSDMLKDNPHKISEAYLTEWKAERIKPLTARVWAKTNQVLTELVAKGLTAQKAIEIMLQQAWADIEVHYFDKYLSNKLVGKKLSADEAIARDQRLAQLEIDNEKRHSEKLAEYNALTQAKLNAEART